MSEETIITDQAGAEDLNESAGVKQELETTRRLFLQRAMAVASGLAIASMLPDIARDLWVTEAQSASCDPAAPGQALQSIMEIKTGSAKILKAVIKVLDERKSIWDRRQREPAGRPATADRCVTSPGMTLTSLRSGGPFGQPNTVCRVPDRRCGRGWETQSKSLSLTT
jgi:hypothetical protein